MNKLKGLAGAGLVAVVMAGCASMPVTEPVAEKLDPDTATTITVLSQPVELFSQNSRAKQTDPFAYIAPFETNRMGSRELFLWVSTPQAQGQLTQPRVKCNGQELNLQPLSQEPGSTASVETGKGGNFGIGADGKAIQVDLSKLSLSRAPYSAPVPWGTQWYFKLSEDGLKCLAEAEAVSLEAQAADGAAEQFSSTGGRKSLASLDAFQRR
ncbi:MAG: hypothetical protein JSR66_31850 [Proteobacteria bacterium]|nr:hypothetical protein [Pseudomonadota bacterium]